MSQYQYPQQPPPQGVYPLESYPPGNPPHGYAQYPPHGPHGYAQHPPAEPQPQYQQFQPAPKEEKSHGCLYTCIAAMCCCWLCGETCECCLECLDCCC